MSIFENDYDLPGVYTEVLPDYSYGYDTSLFGTTDPVLVIGTAFNGPSGSVMAIYSKEHASYVFGKVYDSEKQQESNLVAGIHDAWDRGCRTIYACRVGGKEIYKDFNFRVESKYKLRVSGMFPSNMEKECYFRFDNTNGSESITVYKPADRATIAQKRQGLVEGDNTVIASTLELNLDYGITKDTPLVDMIRLFNNTSNAHQNNVIKLGIVDAEGNDVTNTLEVRNISMGAMYPGIYFIGRAGSACAEETDLAFTLVSTTNVNGVDISNKPFKRFNGNYFRTLKENTDVTQPYPIYADKNTLKNVLKEVGITVNTKKPWEWLEVAELTDRAFVPDEVDYEEVDLSGFALYQRLGSGFATTAMAEKRVDSKGNVITPRVKETPADNPNHIVPILDGVYSMIQDADMKYRVNTCTTAEASTKGKLPRAKDFIQTSPMTTTVLNGLVELIPNVDVDDKTEARSYKIKFQNVPETATADIEKAYVGQVFDVVSILPVTEDDGSPFKIENHNVPQGSRYFEDNGDGSYTLVRCASTVDRLVEGETLVDKYIIAVDGTTNEYALYKGEHSVSGDVTSNIVFKQVTDLSAFKTSDGSANAEFLLGNLVDSMFVYQIDGTKLVPNGDFNGMVTDDQSVPVVYAEDLLFQPNDVIVSSSVFIDTTFDELVDILNEHEVFGKIFTAELTEEGASYKDEKILDIIAPNADPDSTFTLGAVVDLAEDRATDYNYNLYIPYKTTDNFARQFAQHCTYTELKTAPTWGFIGTRRVGAVDLTGVANAVDNVLENNFSLYAKNNVGRNMMDRDNLPYPIGRNLSITFMQYEEYIDNEDYIFISNGAAGYAGMVSNLPLDQSSTNQPFNVTDIAFNLTQYQHSKLNSVGIVTLKRSFTQGIVVLDGTTMAPSDSVFRRLSASRIVGAVEELIRAVAEPYIGKQNHTANRNSLHTAIKGQLDELVGTLLEEYQFQLITDTRAERFNYIDIDYELVPIYEIRQVRNRIKVVETLTQ